MRRNLKEKISLPLMLISVYLKKVYFVYSREEAGATGAALKILPGAKAA
jgi:hypothetical protein